LKEFLQISVLLALSAPLLAQQPTPPLIPKGSLHSALEACDGFEANEAEAERVWTAALDARGGRQKLEQVTTLVLIETEELQKPDFVELFVFPNKFWSWSDTRPDTRFGGLAITVYNGDLKKEWLTSSEDPSPRTLNASPEEQELDFLQPGLLLGHSRTFRPRAIKLLKREAETNSMNVVCAEEGDKVFKFHIDPSTNMIRRAQVFGRWRTGGYGELLRKNYSGYTDVNGLKLPTQISDLDRDPEKTRAYLLKINVPYNEEIFLRPGSLSDGPFAWQK
jgi:hypothetical protein